MACIIVEKDNDVVYEANDNLVLMPDEIQCGFKSYEYSDVEEIYIVQKVVAPIGTIRKKEHVIIVFSDGRSWRNLSEKAMDTHAIEFLESKSGVKAIRTEYAPDI